MWDSFKTELLYKNRFNIKHEVLDYVKKFAIQNQKRLGTETILYRARLYTGDNGYLQYINSDFNDEGLDLTDYLKNQQYKNNIDSRKKSGFWGYDEEASFVPPINDNVGDGRTNPAYIKYLYTSEQPYTALTEIRPYLNSKVSIANISVIEPLNIVDFSQFDNVNDEFETYLIFHIMYDFSKPSDSDVKNYLPTQYISEYIKTLGYEGIRFNSSLHRSGKNITIFNFENCRPISSKLYEINDICFESKTIAPNCEESLVHEKLHPFNRLFKNVEQ